MTTTEKKKLAKYLRYGDLKEIARLANSSISTVSKYLNGYFEYSYVEPYFLKMVEKRKLELESSFQ